MGLRPQSLNFLFSPVTRLKGVGPAVAEALARLVPLGEAGVPIIRDIVFHLPTGVVDRRKTYPLREAPPGVVATFVVRVEAHDAPPRGARHARRPYKVRCSNDTGDLTLVFFHASPDYMQRALPIGEQRVVSGTTEHFEYRLQMTHPDIIAPVSQLADVQIVEPVYPLTVNLTNKKLAGIIRQALAEVPELPEWIPESLRVKYGWPGWREALLQAHAPKEEQDVQPDVPARVRLAYDEALAGQVHLARLKQTRQVRAGQKIISTGALRQALLARLPFQLTKAQTQAIAEIDADLASGHRMGRLLQGDVGSGKTVVALMSALAAVENGFQAAIMAPTELVARQHAENFRRLCDGLHVEVALLTGGLKAAPREQLLEAIAAGSAQIVVGTHALFQEAVQFHQLALVIVDEQHRFGVAQRMALTQKNAQSAPHVLHMTATPIPRSLTMTLYGDMDCSLLLEKPAGRQKVETRVIPLSRFEEVLTRLDAALARGEKIYWVCPMIEESSATTGETAAAEERYRLFATRFGEAAGLVHGRMKPEARDAQMQRFASGACRLLVATTVVEVGVDVPDATIMVIEQAERFGLAQLHQLRGRVGRGDKASSCVLLYSDGAGEEARARLMALRESQDGLEIAEADLRNRGGGDLLGTRQSGLPATHFLSLARHQHLIAEARNQAKEVFAQDPNMQGPQAYALQTLLSLYGYPHA